MPNGSSQRLLSEHFETAVASEGFYNGAAAGARVLVVDDDPRAVFAMTVLLERGQVVVVPASSGQEALELLDHEPATDAVLLDIMMPVMDGYETMDHIHELPENAALPIIAVTASVAVGERARCLAAGAAAYVPKPIDARELITALVEWLPPVGLGWSLRAGPRGPRPGS